MGELIDLIPGVDLGGEGEQARDLLGRVYAYFLGGFAGSEGKRGGEFCSFTDDDLIASDLIYAHVRGETSRVAYNPAHRWYYFTDMQPDEVLFIRVHDSANDGRARPSFHTSFENPLTPGAPPRESIEARAGVLSAGCLTPFS